MAFDRRTGVYHRLSESALAMVRAFDGSRDVAALAEALAARRHGTRPSADPAPAQIEAAQPATAQIEAAQLEPAHIEAAQREVQAFVHHLRRQGVLEGAPAPTPRRRPIRGRRSWLMPRIPRDPTAASPVGPAGRVADGPSPRVDRDAGPGHGRRRGCRRRTGTAGPGATATGPRLGTR